MAERFLRLVIDGKTDGRIWHWTPELAKDPRMQECFPGKAKRHGLSSLSVRTVAIDDDEPKIVYAARLVSFGEFDIVKIIPAMDLDGEPEEEIIDHIIGAEAANARVEELNFPAGRSESEPPRIQVTPEELRKGAIEDAISSLPEEEWSKGPVPYPKVPAVSELVGFKVTFQEIKAVVEGMKATQSPE